MRKRFYPILIPVFCLLIPFCSNAFAAERSALVLAAFGSSRPEAVKSIESFAESLRRERPDLKIVRAFTSPEIVEKLRDGEFETPDAAEAISALAAEGYNKIGVLALYVTPGRGYNELLRTAERLEGLEGGRVKMRVSPPLLGSEADAFSLASYLIYSLPGEIKPGEAVIFAGRGAEKSGQPGLPGLELGLVSARGEGQPLHGREPGKSGKRGPGHADSQAEPAQGGLAGSAHERERNPGRRRDFRQRRRQPRLAPQGCRAHRAPLQAGTGLQPLGADHVEGPAQKNAAPAGRPAALNPAGRA